MDTVVEALPAASPYTPRILPPEEWDRLPAEVVGGLNPNYAVVLVVEDLAGAIVGRWVVLNTVHLEGLEIDEAHRGNPVVAGQLVRAMITALKEMAIPSVLTIIQDPRVRAMADHFGFRPIPGTIHRLDL